MDVMQLISLWKIKMLATEKARWNRVRMKDERQVRSKKKKRKEIEKCNKLCESRTIWQNHCVKNKIWRSCNNEKKIELRKPSERKKLTEKVFSLLLLRRRRLFFYSLRFRLFFSNFGNQWMVSYRRVHLRWEKIIRGTHDLRFLFHFFYSFSYFFK